MRGPIDRRSARHTGVVSVTTTGAIGQSTRLTIDRFGTVHGAGAPLGWFVAAEDRWHDPRTDSAVRHGRVSGTPVTETRVRVPGGDVVQRVFTVADYGGITVIEIDNASTLPVAVAFDRRDLLTERPIPGTPIEGIDLPPGSFVVPVAHQATIRVGLAHHNPTTGSLPPIPTAADVVKGWLATVARAGRIEVPSPAILDSIVEARCAVACGEIDDPISDPARWLVGLDQWHRLGLSSAAELDLATPDVAGAVAAIGPTSGWFIDAALAAAQRLLLAADERRAAADVGRILNDRPESDLPPAEAEDSTALVRTAHVERLLVRGAELLPAGVPPAWRGHSFECHGLPSVAGSSLSFALRWHGDRPAILWQQDGPLVELSSPLIDATWRSAADSGEALLSAPGN